jgi:hypothetical protein
MRARLAAAIAALVTAAALAAQFLRFALDATPSETPTA